MSLKIVVLAKQSARYQKCGEGCHERGRNDQPCRLACYLQPRRFECLGTGSATERTNPGSTITLLTMGPPRAAEIIREGLFRGADGGIVLTDRAFAGADTLATSYALSCAVRKIKDYDIILGGRQAIDGDTAQVGPQIAEKNWEYPKSPMPSKF